MIVDAVLVDDEVDLLRLRIDYLKEVVDRFLVLESRETFRGTSKPLHVHQRIDEFHDVADQLDVVEYTFPEGMTHAWHREAHARDRIGDELPRYPLDAVLIVCDVDEFPHPLQIEACRSLREPRSLPMATFYRRANWRLLAETESLAVKALPVRTAGKVSELRWQRDGSVPPVGGPWGWHMSYMGFDDSSLAKKYAHFSHAEVDRPASSSAALVALADRFAVDHLGRYRSPGEGLLEVVPRSNWGELQYWLLDRRPAWFDSRHRLPPTVLRQMGAVLIGGIVQEDRDEWTHLLEPRGVLSPSGLRSGAEIARRALGVRRRARSMGHTW